MRPNQIYGPGDAEVDERLIPAWQEYLRIAFVNRHGNERLWDGYKYADPCEVVVKRIGQIRGARKRLAAYEAGTPYRLDANYFWRENDK